MKRKLIITALIAVIFVGCKEAVLNEKPYPVIQTYDAEIKGPEVILKGQIYTLGSEPVIEYGFLVNGNDNDFSNAGVDTIRINDEFEEGEFNKSFSAPWNVFFYCTYVKTENYKVIGNYKLVRR